MRFSVAVVLWLLCMPVLAQLNPDVDTDTTKWFNRTQQLKNVDVKAKRNRYSRKNNPAVELMRKVIAAKKNTNLRNRDFYQYTKYQKMTFAVNEITERHLLNPRYNKHKWLVHHVEFCPYNRQYILPVSVEETVTQELYRKSPQTERTIVRGYNSTGVNDFLQTGDIMKVVLNDVFTDVNIYEDQIRLLQFPFTSPIGKDAIGFYRYYIEDTVYVERPRVGEGQSGTGDEKISDLCYHLSFIPNNQQDFGFRGDLFILADSSYQVRRCQMTIPNNSDVNFVTGMKLVQEFSQLDDGSWVLSADDMFTELRWADYMESFAVVRNRRLSHFSFGELSPQLFKGERQEVREQGAETRNEAFWEHYRKVPLTRSEASMDDFVKGFHQINGFGYILIGLKMLIENYVETSSKRPNKVDIGPINTMITTNFIDGLRTRFPMHTTANFHPNLFLSGYVAHGWGSHNTYYRGDVIWSLNKKDYVPWEYPKRTITFSSTFDVMSPCDKFLDTDKDNVFSSFKWASVEQMMYYNRQKIAFEYEVYGGLKTTFSAKTERDTPAGNIDFEPLRTTELHAELRYAPGETFITTKQRRTTTNHDAPVFTLGHTVGLKGILGGDQTFHLSEATVYKRFWLNSWGRVDCRMKGAIQWNQVPMMLLIMPEANLSYVRSDYMFALVNNMEFLTDRYASLMIDWDINGKIFNRIPLLRRLKWREWLTLRCMWGTLTEKNKAALQGLPTANSLGDAPYWEAAVGIHNIFRLFHVEYVRRLNYLDLPTAKKHGVRFTMRMSF